jgi:ERCC4-type nuclease
MPKHEPAQIHIRIDTQEQRSGIPTLLATMPQVDIEVIPLRMGDYDVGGDPRRVFERKTGSDFLSSLAQGRLFAQLAAHLVYAAAKQCQIGHATPGPAAGRRGASLPERQMQIVLSLPGIGPVTARAVCARFRSLHDLLSADAAQLSTVPGVSPTRAAALEQLLHAALPSFDAGGTREARDASHHPAVAGCDTVTSY